MDDPCHGRDMPEGLWLVDDPSRVRNTLRDSGAWRVHSGAETLLRDCDPHATPTMVGRSLTDHDL